MEEDTKLTPELAEALIKKIIEPWFESTDEATNWYENQFHRSFGSTIKEAVDNGRLVSALEFIGHLDEGGFA